VFEPATEVIRKGKAGKPTEFGEMVKLQEAENQIIVDYEVIDRLAPEPVAVQGVGRPSKT
jgi:transposase, IS5 family